MRGGFNSSFIEVSTLEGDKFLRDLRPGELILTQDKNFSKIAAISKRLAQVGESIFNIYYSEKEEGVLDRVSGEQELSDGRKIKNLKVGDLILCKKGVLAKVDKIEKMETFNRFFYNIILEKNKTFYANNVCMKSIGIKNNSYI